MRCSSGENGKAYKRLQQIHISTPLSNRQHDQQYNHISCLKKNSNSRSSLSRKKRRLRKRKSLRRKKESRRIIILSERTSPKRKKKGNSLKALKRQNLNLSSSSPSRFRAMTKTRSICPHPPALRPTPKTLLARGPPETSSWDHCALIASLYPTRWLSLQRMSSLAAETMKRSTR